MRTTEKEEKFLQMGERKSAERTVEVKSGGAFRQGEGEAHSVAHR